MLPLVTRVSERSARPGLANRPWCNHKEPQYLMTETRRPDDLGSNAVDYLTSLAKATVGAAPYVGSLLAELVGTVIPNQRLDRVVRFARELAIRLTKVEADVLRAKLSDENFTDLLEEGLRQAARSTTDERRAHVASVVANSLTSEEISFIESKHLLRLLGEVNDIEVVWLRSYLDPTMGGDREFREKHGGILAMTYATMGSSQSDIDKETLQRSYREHLERLGLLRERYRMDSKTKLPELDRDGRPKVQGYELTRLGRLLLRQIGFHDPRASSPSVE
jgi:hypothetical protein